MRLVAPGGGCCSGERLKAPPEEKYKPIARVQSVYTALSMAMECRRG